MKFNELGINEEITNVLSSLGFEQPTQIQQKAIPVILNKKDIVGRSETGSGKTFAFGLPLLQMVNKEDEQLQELVVCPTRELTVQVADELKKIAMQIGVRISAVFGGSNMDRQIASIKKHPSILVGTPGRLIDLYNRKALKLSQTSILVLDEADEMLDMGFRPDIEKIIKACSKQRQTILFSATMPDAIKDIVNNYLTESVMVEVGAENKALDKIDQSYIFVNQKDKKDLTKQLFYNDIFDKTIMFVNTKRYAEELELALNKMGVNCKAIHGDLKQSERRTVLKNFKSGKFQVLIATDVAARGLDIKDVKVVVNYDLPQILEYYVHRIGRTARAGESGKVVNLITNISQLSYMKEIEKTTKANIKKYETNNQNINQYFVDTKKLAQKNNRFVSNSREKLREKMFGKSTKNQQEEKIGLKQKSNKVESFEKQDMQTLKNDKFLLQNKKFVKEQTNSNSQNAKATKLKDYLNKNHSFENSQKSKVFSNAKKLNNLKAKHLKSNYHNNDFADFENTKTTKNSFSKKGGNLQRAKSKTANKNNRKSKTDGITSKNKNSKNNTQNKWYQIYKK